MKLRLYKREGEAERGLLKVAPVIADKLPLAIYRFAKMPFFIIRVAVNYFQEENYRKSITFRQLLKLTCE